MTRNPMNSFSLSFFNRLFPLLALFAASLSLSAEEPAKKPEAPKEEWNGYEIRKFDVQSRGSMLVIPKTPAPGKPWIWRTEFFGIDPQADIALLGKGFHVAYINVGGLYGAPVALDAMDAFYDYVVKTYGVNAKVVVEGFSRGGLYALNWGIRHPNRVACMYLDAPVCDFKSWPGGGSGSQGRLVKMYGREWGEVLAAYKMNDEQARAYKGNPIDKNENLEPMSKAKIPILVVCGDMQDWIVPIDGNTLVLEKRYKELGGDITVIRKPGAGHRPHSLPDPTPIVDFVVKHTKGLK
jgi:pimeloyl-ACP methyl ester carboxylesterase